MTGASSPPRALSLGMLLTATLACVATSSCGVPDHHHGSASQNSFGAPQSTGYLASDGDADNDDGSPGIEGVEKGDTLYPVGYGQEASQSDKLKIATLIVSYYSAAVASDGAKACRLLDSTLAAGLNEGAGASTQGANSPCALTLSHLFEREHQHLKADDVSQMEMIDLRVKGGHALATLGFKTRPIGEMPLTNEQGAWKIDALLDNGLD